VSININRLKVEHSQLDQVIC